MRTEFNTEIVKSKEFNTIFKIIYGILYMIASFYIFLYDKESQSIYINYLAIAINLSGVYFLFGQSFIKPKNIGILKITDEKVEFDKNGLNKSIMLTELETISLRYLDYGSWSSHSIFGNKNYLEIIEKSGEKFELEILIRSRNAKNDLKKVLNSPEFIGKFDFIQASNSRTDF